MSQFERRAAIDEKIGLVRERMRACDLCERRCGVDRMSGEQGFCQLDARAYCYRELLHFGEEIELVPSHTIYLSGCNLRCRFCSDWDHVEAAAHGEATEPEWMAERIRIRRDEGARNVNFVGGEPTVNLLFILRTLRHLPEPVPVVWNSNMYMAAEVLQILDGVVDSYLADLKFGNGECAATTAGVQGYLPVVQRNLLDVNRQAAVIVRHLVMPGHLECCARPALEWLAGNLPEARVSMLVQYRPTVQAAGDRRLDRPLDPSEFAAAEKIARELGLKLDATPGPALRQGPASTGPLETRISIGPEGEVTFHDLPREFVDVATELDPEATELTQRTQMESRTDKSASQKTQRSKE